HLLGQAKMEPGNRVMVQLSPTVQATPSNYTRVHGGRATPLLERFLGPTRGRVLVDLVQSEQGSRYLHKRNRSMIVMVDDELPVTDDFAWLSLDQIRGLLRAGCSMNMNARSVLACLPPAEQPSDGELASALAWLHDIKTELRMGVRRIRLGELEDW